MIKSIINGVTIKYYPAHFMCGIILLLCVPVLDAEEQDLSVLNRDELEQAIREVKDYS